MNLSYKDVLAFGLPYLVGVGAAYTLGYWGSFGINVLEFIGLSELGKMAVYPLLATLALGVLAMLGTQLLAARVLPPGGGANTPIGRAGVKHWRILVALLVLCIIAAATYAPEPGKWFLVAVLVGPLSVPLQHASQIREVLPNPPLRSLVLLLVVSLPAFSFAQGRLKAHLVKLGKGELAVDHRRSALPPPTDPEGQLAYVGFVGGTYVLRETRTGVLLLVKAKDNAPLYLQPVAR